MNADIIDQHSSYSCFRTLVGEMCMALSDWRLTVIVVIRIDVTNATI